MSNRNRYKIERKVKVKSLRHSISQAEQVQKFILEFEPESHSWLIVIPQHIMFKHKMIMEEEND